MTGKSRRTELQGIGAWTLLNVCKGYIVRPGLAGLWRQACNEKRKGKKLEK